jgi:hypothetical protein
MTLNPMFNALEGFDTFSIPGAVSNGGGPGGAGGPGALGGLGGLGGVGGLGGAGGGFRSVAMPGPTLMAGMDGVVGPGQAPVPDGYYAQRPAPIASPDASSFLSGAAGFPGRPRLSDRAGPYPAGPRAGASRRPGAASKAKRKAASRR